MKGGAKVVIEPHRHEGIFIAKGKEDALVTRNGNPGESVYGEKRISVDDPAEEGKKIEYRVWNPFRSKIAAAVLGGIDHLHIKPGSKVLYLGAASGTSVSHVSDIVGPTGVVYAVEFSHRPGLINMAKKRTNVVPIVEDARMPLKYRMLVGMVDVIFADVAQPDQSRIVALNASYFLKVGGHFVISIKASCVDSTAAPEAVFASEVNKLRKDNFKPQEQVTLEPYERDHAVVIGTYCAGPLAPLRTVQEGQAAPQPNGPASTHAPAPIVAFSPGTPNAPFGTSNASFGTPNASLGTPNASGPSIASSMPSPPLSSFKCDRGHTLSRETKKGRWYCAKCGRSLGHFGTLVVLKGKKGTRRLRCDICQYDLCATCEASAAGGAATGAAAPQDSVDTSQEQIDTSQDSLAASGLAAVAMDEDVTDTHIIVSLIESGPPGSPGTDNSAAAALAFGGRFVASIDDKCHLRIYAQSPLREGDKVKVCATFFGADTSEKTTGGFGSSAPATGGAAPAAGGSHLKPRFTFGTSATSTGAAAAAPSFGAPATTGAGFGAFGQNAAAAPSFGAPATTGAGFGAFGQNTGGAFGAATGGVFGAKPAVIRASGNGYRF